jgi:NADH-quinone oxidoreductase subunit G
MPKLVIDDRKIEVVPGTKVIEAAAQLGIMIPRFCYHPALGSVGACRVCAVKFLQGPVKGVQMSCMIEAKDDMVVSTTDKEALDFRKHVIEWLMLNHPHDCPVCDEGGHCLLQDMTVSGGHGIRRYPGNKRTYPDQYLGSLVQHEMNRCIHCYRCSRYYQEFTGYRDLGVMRNASRTYFGRFQDGILESPFTGNLSDICPTGVYTDKPSRFFGRRWDYQRSPSVCINCCLGCHTVASIRYREVKRQEARFSKDVNGYFICDRGRYGFFYANLESRPRSARVDGREVLWDQAVQAAKNKLAQISRNAGPSAVAVAGSPRSSLETQAMLKHLCRINGWAKPVFFMDPALTTRVKTSIARLESELTVPLNEVEKADYILAVGVDPVNEAPMLALAMRQARRNGAGVAVLDPRPVSMPLDFVHLPAALEDLSFHLSAFMKGSLDRDIATRLGEKAAEFYDAAAADHLSTNPQDELIAAVIHDLRKSKRPVIVCGTDIVPHPVPGLAADFALLLQAAEKKAGLFYQLPGANAFGAGLLSDRQGSFLQIIEGIENGAIKSLILTECDPFHRFADRKRLERALNSLDLLIVMDYIDSEAAQKAHIFLPAATLYEAGGIFINQEGRAQAAPRAYEGGRPIVQSGGGDHPPRIYGQGIPGAAPKPAWMTLAELTNEKLPPDSEKLRADIRLRLADDIPGLADLQSFNDIPDDGIRLELAAEPDLRFTTDELRPFEKPAEQGESLELILVDWTFGTEELSALSACLRELEPEPCLIMHTKDATDMGLIDGERVIIQADNGNLEIKLRVVGNMAAGVLVIPRHRKLPWQIFETGMIRIGREQIKKVGA